MKADTYLIQMLDGTPRKLPVAFSKFPDGDTHCVIAEPQKLLPGPMLVVHPLYPDQNEQLIRLLLLIDLLHDLGVDDISIFTPYLPYSRQDKRYEPGEALSMNTICRMIAASGCRQLYVVDCHFMRNTERGEYAGLHIVNVPAMPLLLEACRKKYLQHTPHQVVGTDKGSKLLAGDAVEAHMHKTRGGYAKGATRSRDVDNMSADHISLKHDAIIVVDDMVSTGSTMIKALASLRQKGAGKLYCVATHGLFLQDSFAKITQLTDGVMVADTIPHAASQPVVAALLREKILPEVFSGVRA